MICKVEMVKANDSTMAIRQESGVMNVKMTEQTKIYLDKSKLKLLSADGNV